MSSAIPQGGQGTRLRGREAGTVLKAREWPGGAHGSEGRDLNRSNRRGSSGLVVTKGDSVNRAEAEEMGECRKVRRYS